MIGDRDCETDEAVAIVGDTSCDDDDVWAEVIDDEGDTMTTKQNILMTKNMNCGEDVIWQPTILHT